MTSCQGDELKGKKYLDEKEDFEYIEMYGNDYIQEMKNKPPILT